MAWLKRTEVLCNVFFTMNFFLKKEPIRVHFSPGFLSGAGFVNKKAMVRPRIELKHN
jgi:hypothetical protein